MATSTLTDKPTYSPADLARGAEKASPHSLFASLSIETTVRQLCASEALNQWTSEDVRGRLWIGRCGSKTARLATRAAPIQEAAHLSGGGGI